MTSEALPRRFDRNADWRLAQSAFLWSSVAAHHSRDRPCPTRLEIIYYDMKYEHRIRTSKVGERGQVTIPQALRTRYGVMPGEEVVFEETKDGLLLRKVLREDPLRALVGRVREPLDVDEYLNQTRGAVWSRELDE